MKGISKLRRSLCKQITETEKRNKRESMHKSNPHASNWEGASKPMQTCKSSASDHSSVY